MTIRIERIDKSNAELLGEVADEVFDHAISPNRLAAFLDDPSHVLFIAMSGPLVVGHARAVIHKHPDQAPDLFIDNLGVAPSFQRKGIATRLINALMEAGRQNGCEEVWVGTEPENVRARSFYKSLGLTEQSIAMFDGKV